MKIVVATNNEHKIEEFQKIFRGRGLKQIELVSLKSLNIDSNPKETSKSLRGNAIIKAEAVYKLCGLPTISDDSGLFVFSLFGAPGVRSARYAGKNATDSQNRKLLLERMRNDKDRYAYFKTVLQFISPTVRKTFIGRTDGIITNRERGENGFGYDSVFIPNGYDLTFADMEPNLKNKLSHRYDAANKFAVWIKKRYLTDNF